MNHNNDNNNDNNGILNNKINHFILPGDIIGRFNINIKIGSGLLQDNSNIIATKAGILKYRDPNKYWIENKQKRYIPAVEEMVIGIITEKHQEGFKVDIGSSHYASLNWEGFESSSRKNRVQWPPGSVIYARVILANKDMEPEIACKTINGKAKGFGKLDDGIIIKSSLLYCRELLSNNTSVLKYLGKKIPYEIAIGLNGRIWIKSNNARNTILISNAIKLSENLPEDKIELMISQMIESI